LFQLTVDKDGHSYFATLEIKNVTVEDAGKYKVTAKNELGESNATISLNFDSKYLLFFTINNRKVMYFNRWSVFIFCVHLLNFLFTSIYARRVLYSIIWVTTFYLDCKIVLKFNFEFSKHLIFVLKYFRYNLIILTNSFLYYFNNFLNGYVINWDYLIVKISKDKITFCF